MQSPRPAWTPGSESEVEQSRDTGAGGVEELRADDV